MIEVIVNSGQLGALGAEAQGFEAIEGLGPYVVQLVSVGLALPRIIRLPLNPESWERAHSQGWRSRAVPGATQQRLDWESNGAAGLRFEFVVQLDDARQLEAQVLQPLERLGLELAPGTQEPAAWFVTFGHHQYRVVITEVTVTRTRTNQQGDATLARVQISAQDQTK